MSSDDGGTWAPFGPSSDDEPPSAPVSEPVPESTPPPVEDPQPEPAPVSEPPPAEPDPLPAAAFAPPVATPLPTLPEPSGLGWPSHTAPAPPPVPEPTGQPAPWPPSGFQTPKTVPSSATVALVVGIVSVLFCGFAGPFAIHYALRARREIDADPNLGGRGLASWGLGLGIVSTTLLVLLLILIAAGVIALN